MKKQELETGMYVKLKNGSICVVQHEQDLLVDVKDGTYARLRYYNDDLITGCDIIHSLDIIVVYDDYKMEKIIWERSKELLTQEEKEWIKAVIKPFKDKVNYVIKRDNCNDKTYIEIGIEKDSAILLPYIDNMLLKFKGIELCKKYSLKELGLED